VGTYPQNSHLKTALKPFWSKTWRRCGSAVPTRYRPSTPLR